MVIGGGSTEKGRKGVLRDQQEEGQAGEGGKRKAVMKSIKRLAEGKGGEAPTVEPESRGFERNCPAVLQKE